MSYTGVILEFGVRKETTSKFPGLHSFISIGLLPYDEKTDRYEDIVMCWLENISLEVIEFAN